MDELQRLERVQERGDGMSDLIDRQAAIGALWEKRQALNDYMEILLQDGKMSSRYLTKIERNRIEEDINIIEQLPPAQPERIKGHWVNGRCDKCNEHAPFWAMASTYHESNFCPNCGAEMRKEKEK